MIHDLRTKWWTCLACREVPVPGPRDICHDCQMAANPPPPGPPDVCICRAGDGSDDCPWADDCYDRWRQAKMTKLEQLALDLEERAAIQGGWSGWRGIQDVQVTGGQL